MSAIKRAAKIKHFDDTGNICEGCGKPHSGLDYSHILSVGQRKDLELEKDNKNLLCRTCHQTWESWNVEKMFKLNCIYNNLEYIRAMDEQTFWKIYFKCIDFQKFTYANVLLSIPIRFAN